MFNAFSNELQFTLKNKLQNKSRLVFTSSTAPKVPDLNSPHSLSLSSSSFSRSTTHISPSNSICHSVAAAARSWLLQLLSSLGILLQLLPVHCCCCCSSSSLLLLLDPAATALSLGCCCSSTRVLLLLDPAAAALPLACCCC